MSERHERMRRAWLAVADVCDIAFGPAAIARAVDVAVCPSGTNTWRDLGTAIREMCGPDEVAPPDAAARPTITADDVLTDLRALLALDWPTLTYVPDDGWQEGACNLDVFQTAVDSLIGESADGWADDAESTVEVSCVPLRRLTLVHRDLDPEGYEAGRMRSNGWDYIADGVVVQYPDLRATMTAAAQEIERLRADAPPPADVSLLALANRTLAAELEAARAEVEQAEQRVWAAVRDGVLLADELIDSAKQRTAATATIRALTAERERLREERDEAWAEIVEAMTTLDAGSEFLGDGTPVPTTLVPRARNVAMALAAEAEEANRLGGEVTRLTRERDVERGDQTQAPAGWRRYGDASWRIPGANGAIIQRACDGALDTWIRRGVLRDDPRCRIWPSALEAMEAIDAERGVSHA